MAMMSHRPSAPLSRRHSPRGYTDYHSYRPWLRDEFCFRCAYCLLREQGGQIRGGHSIDHFEAVAQNPDRANEYDNLLYACAACNLAKAARNVPDPTAVLLSPNVWVSPDGAIHATAPEAAKLIDLLGVDRPKAREYLRGPLPDAAGYHGLESRFPLARWRSSRRIA